MKPITKLLLAFELCSLAFCAETADKESKPESQEPVSASEQSTAKDIANYEKGGELERDPSEVPVDAPKDLKLILCIGQSNMAGRAKPTEADLQTVPNVYKLNRDDKWVAAKAPYHFDKAVAGVGPIDDFVKLYLKDHPEDNIGVIPCAVGGSAVSTWLPGNGKHEPGKNYSRALARAKIAQANGKFIAILWHQGETDAAKSSEDKLKGTYAERVKSVAEGLRRGLGNENIPFIVGEIGRWRRGDGDHAAKINPCINKVPQLIPLCACVSSEGLKNQDRHHFNREGQQKLAKRYYEAFQELTNEK